MTDGAFNIFVVVLIIFILVLCWVLLERKRGEQNPVGTGQVKDDVHRIRERMGEIEGDVENIKEQMKQHATRADLARIEEMMRGNAALAKRTADQIDRIEGFMLQKGLGSK